MEEIWKKIDGFPNYSISNMGNVRNDNTNKPIKCHPRCKGYLYVNLMNKGKMSQFRVHRIVATHFVPNPNNYPLVNHINEIKSDNRVENLEWVTPQENVNYGLGIDKMLKSRTGRFKPKKCMIEGVIYESISKAAKALNIKGLPQAVNRGLRIYKGYKITIIEE
jgi:hypothetical protein